MAVGKAPWCTLHGTGDTVVLECQHCKKNEKVKLSIAVGDLTKKMNAFIKIHINCKKN